MFFPSHSFQAASSSAQRVAPGFGKILFFAGVVIEVEEFASLRPRRGDEFPCTAAHRHLLAEPPEQRLVRGAVHFALPIGQQVDTFPLGRGGLFEPAGRERCRRQIDLDDRMFERLSLRQTAFPPGEEGTRMPPSHVCAFRPRSGPFDDPLAGGPPLSLMKKMSVDSSSPASRTLPRTWPMASSIALIMAA